MQKNKIKDKVTSIENPNNTRNIIKENESILNGLVSTILTSFRVGTFGFAVVLTLIIVTKLLAYSIGAKEIFTLNLNDIIFSSWGFIIFSFSKFISYQKN